MLRLTNDLFPDYGERSIATMLEAAKKYYKRKFYV
jgi:hypothetical protein